MAAARTVDQRRKHNEYVRQWRAAKKRAVAFGNPSEIAFLFREASRVPARPVLCGRGAFASEADRA